MKKTSLINLIVILGAVLLWFSPHPQQISAASWQLFIIFAAIIVTALFNSLPLFVASIAGAAVAILTHTVEPSQVFSGLSKGFILMVVAVYIMARGMVNSGLGNRIGFFLISRFGKSTLSLGYCLVAIDAIIAPAFVSNTARSGILFSFAYPLAKDIGSEPHSESRRQGGAFLMMIGIASLTISSALWFTAMGANPMGAQLVEEIIGQEINFANWFLAASLPSLAALIFIPWLIYKVFPPSVQQTPEAPQKAREELKKMGPLSRQEWITIGIFSSMILLWALSSFFAIDKAAVALLGLSGLIFSGVLTTKDIQESGDALEFFFWFAILYSMSSALNELGFMKYVAGSIGGSLQDLAWPLVYLGLTGIYVFIHYLFVSQTAHLVALLALFTQIGVQAGVPGPLIAFQLLFATNYFAAMSPQASSCNVLFTGSGYLEVKEVYRVGGLVTLANTLIYLIIGSPWIYFLFVD